MQTQEFTYAQIPQTTNLKPRTLNNKPKTTNQEKDSFIRDLFVPKESHLELLDVHFYRKINGERPKPERP